MKLETKKLLPRYLIDFFEDDGWHLSCNALYLACRFGDLEAVKMLLEAGIQKDTTHLMIASRKGHASVVKLLTSDHDYHYRRSALDNSIQEACREGHCEVIQILLALGANKHTALKEAGENGHVKAVSLLLNSVNMDTLHMSSLCGDLLLTCCRKGYIQLAKLLLDHNDVLINMRPVNPLHIAVQNDDINMIKLLLSYGANIEAAQVTCAELLQLDKNKGDGALLKLLGKEISETPEISLAEAYKKLKSKPR